MVFEGYIAFTLSTYLGRFVKGLNKDSVNVSLLRGSIELKKLELSPDLLSFSESLELERGTIGTLSIKIPWHSIYSKRCEVTVRDVIITIVPKYQRSDAPTEFFRSKEEFLTATQGVLAHKANEETPEKDCKDSFLGRLQHAILKHLAFRLENISFRLEDKTGCWKGQTAGVHAHFDKLTCEATDSNYKPVFIGLEDKAVSESFYRLTSYEGASVYLLYSSNNDKKVLQQPSSQFRRWESADTFSNAEYVLMSSDGVLTVCWQNQPSNEQKKLRVCIALVTRKVALKWSESCIMAIGILFESVKQAPRRAFVGDSRPASRIQAGDPAGTSKWWTYAIGRVVAYQQRKLFLSSLFTFCLQLLQAPWIPDGQGQNLSDDQLASISAQDVMACWNAARECLAQFQRTKTPLQGDAYTQYLHYRYMNEQKSRDGSFPGWYPSIALPVEIVLTIECSELAVSLDQNLRGVANQAYIGATVSKDQLHVQLSAATATVVAEENEDNPVLAIAGSDTAGVLLIASKRGHSPSSGELVIEEIVTCLDLCFQELLVAKVTSYIAAAKPFLYQDLLDGSPAAVLVEDKLDYLAMKKQQQLFSSFGIIVKSITGKAGGVYLHAQRSQLALAQNMPIVVEIQEMSVIANDSTLVQLCSITVAPTVVSDGIRIEVVTDSASMSTNVEGFDYVKQLLESMKQQWSSHASSFVSDPHARSSADAKRGALLKEEKSQVNLALRFEFIEYGALALEKFSVRATFGDGWYIHLSAAGGTTEGWCHSIPPRPQDPFIDIQIWAGDFLAHSPFAGNIEDSGTAFTCSFNHVTLSLGDDLICSVESLYDTVVMILFEEDRHVYLTERDKYTTPHVSGFFTGTHTMLLLDSNGGDLTLLPEYADSAVPGGTAGSANMRHLGATPPLTPSPLTVELLGEECLHVSLQRYSDKRMDIHVVLQKGVNAYLIDAPAHIPLLVPRESMRAEVDFHLCAPSDADLLMFPYGRMNMTMKLSNVAVVTHMPTLMAAWAHFNTPSLPLCRLCNIGSRLHFSSRRSHPGVTLAPRSPASASVEALGAAAFARISRLPESGVKDTSASLTTLASCATYSAQVFPSDVRLCIEVAKSELYYPWGEGSVAPLYLHAEVPSWESVLLKRDDCVEVTARGLLSMPRVSAMLHTLPRTMSETAAQYAEGSAVRAAHSPDVQHAAFPDEEYFATPQHWASPPPASSLIQVHVVYTMDSRPPFCPGSSDESLRVSLTATAVPGSGALPGPLHMSLRSPAEVAAWLTFFTFFNLTNTVPLPISGHAATASSAFASEGKDNGGGDGSSITTVKAQNPRRLIVNVHSSPIVFHLPFAAAAAVLWDGLEYVASPGYNALSIPKLDVLVHEQLWYAAATGMETLVQQLAALRDSGYAVLSLRSSSSSSSRSTGEVDMVPAILFESHATGPTAVKVRRRLVLPAIVGQLSHTTTLVQLQQCSTLAAVSAVFEARSAQTALLNAVILQESQRQKLRYACCCTTSAGGGGSSCNSSGTDADAQAQLLPLLSPPLAIHIHSACLTFEWVSGLQRGLRAGVTVALANARCNDYNTPSRHLSADQLTDDNCDTTAHTPQRFPLTASVPLLVEVEAVEAYVWWTTAESTSTTEAAVGEKVTSLEEPQPTSKQHLNLPLVTACMPLLLYPLQVRTRFDTASQTGDAGAGKTANGTGSVVAPSSRIFVSVEQEDARVAASEEELEISFAVNGGDDITSAIMSRSQSPSTASLHTIMSTTSDSKSNVTATAAPSSIRTPTRPAEAQPTSVFLVTPICVVLNTSAYVVLSEMLLHKVQGKTAATTTGAQGAVAVTTPPVPQGIAAVSQYYLTYLVEPPMAARGSAATSSPSISSPLSPLTYSRSGSSSYTGSPSNGLGGSSGRYASSRALPALLRMTKMMYVLRYDSAQQRVWTEKQSQATWKLEKQQVNDANSARKEECVRESSVGGPGEMVEEKERSTSSIFLPLPSLHTVGGMPILPTPTENEAPVESQEAEAYNGHAQSLTHVTAAMPTLMSQATTKSRLQMRMAVAEVCIRLVYYRDAETGAATASEEQDFWQHYAVVHAATRCVAAASPTPATTARTPRLMTFLATTVAPLQSLHPASKHTNMNSSSTSQSSMSSNVSLTSRSRTLWQLGPPPASPTAVRQQLLAPTTILEEACVDVLRVQLSGVIVSSFTDARSVQLESCVCTSVKSPSRPLLSMTQVELYVPSSAITYPSAEKAEETVARDLQGAAWVPEVARGMETAPAAQSISAFPTTSRQDTNAFAALWAPVLSQPQPQPSEPTRRAGRSSLVDPPSVAAAPTAPSTSADTSNRNDSGDQRQAAMMQGEVGCRLETLVVDLSAVALRAWLSCLVEHPVAALRAAAEEEEKRVRAIANRPHSADTVAAVTTLLDKSEEEATVPVLSPVQWKPGQGLRVHEIREAFWSLEHDITLSRDGLVLFFSSQDTNLLTVYLNGHDIVLDPSLLLRPAGLQRVVVVVQSGLTVRFVGSGRVRLPLALWSSSLVETAANVGVETALLPFMAIGEGSYLECTQVRLGFTETTAGSSAGGGNGWATTTSTQKPVPDSSAFSSKHSTVVKAAERSEEARADVSSPSPPPSSHADLHNSQMVHRNVHFHLPHISVIIEPRHESRQLHIRTAVDSWMSLCNGRLLHDDVRCTKFMVLSESVYNAATTTARTTVLAPVDVRVCSNNGRHHAVSLGAVQVDLGCADLLIMSTYAGELQALRLYAKHLAHSKAEKAFLEMVEATLAWKASAATTNHIGAQGEEDEQDDELYDDEGDVSDKSKEKEEEQERPTSGASGGSEHEGTVLAMPPSRSGYARVNHTNKASATAASTAAASDGANSVDRPRPLLSGPSTECYRKMPPPATLQNSAPYRSSVTKRFLRQGGAASKEDDDGQVRPTSTVDARRQQQQQRRRRRQQLRLQKQQSREFSWVVFTASVEVIFSDHRYPLVQMHVQDVVVRRTSTSALASTSLVQCQRASVRVHGRGRWDVLLKPSAALTWSLTQTVSRHSSNRHTSLVVDGVHWQCSHLIVAKILYINHQFGTLATCLRRRLTMAVAAVGEAGSSAAPASVAGVALASLTKGRGEEKGLGRDSRSDTTASSTSVSSDGDDSSNSGSDKSRSSSGRESNANTETFSDTSSKRPQLQPRRDIVAMGTGDQSSVDALTVAATSSASPFPAAAATTSNPLVMSMSLSQRDGHRRPSGTSGTGAPLATTTISPRMATHRLLNSFSHTLFAAICERAAVTKVPSTATSDVRSSAVRSVDPSPSLTSAAVTAVPMLWRCNELYRLPPASSTDIFISYRRAHSLMLTFFTAECVEWNRVKGAWALNAEGETALAARATISAAKSTTRVPLMTPQQHPDTSSAASSFLSCVAIPAATTNWLAFTSLQYGMARPLTVHTTLPRGTAAAAAPTPTAASPSCLDSNMTSRPRSPMAAASWMTTTAAGISDYGDSHRSGGGFKTPAYSLALTCVDTEEEADTLCYPIVVTSEENNDDGSTPAAHQQQHYHRRHAHHRSPTASSADTSAPPSRNASFMCAGSLAKDVASQMTRGGSSSRAGATRRTSGDCAPAECRGPPLHNQLHSTHDRYDRLQVHCGTASTNSHPGQRHGGGATLSTGTEESQQPSGQWKEESRTHDTAHVPLVAHQQHPQPPSHSPAATAPVASGQDIEGGSGDLLVVRLQARSSLCNETGCTLQLLSSPELFKGSNSAADAVSWPATSATVPPGWQLPLYEENVHKEVVLRVCCPSTRWMPSPAARSAAAVSSDNMNVSGYTVGVTETMSTAATHLRWYEARIVLGQLESGRFLSFRRVDVGGGAVPPSAGVAGAAAAKDAACPLHHRATSSHFGDDDDARLLALFVIRTYSADGLVQRIALYPRLTLVNHLGLTARVVVLQQDPLAGPQTPDEATLIAQWTAPFVGRGRHDRERFYRSLVTLGAHDALPHQHALPLHFCTYGSNLVLGLSFTQSTGDAFFTADLDSVITHLRDAVDHHPRLLQLRDNNGRPFYVQVSVMSRTVVLSVALWVYNLTEYPLLMTDSVLQGRLCPGQNSTSGIIPSQGEPFLIGCQLADFTQGFFAIGMDGGWSGAVPIDVGSSGVFVSALPQLGITRSCNYSILFPNAQEGRPIVIQITPRWVFYNNTSKRLRLQFRFPGLENEMQKAERRRRRLLMREIGTTTAESGNEAATLPFTAAETAPQAVRRRLLLETDDTVGALTSIAEVQLNPGDYHVSCIGPIEGNQFRVQEVLQGALPTIMSITGSDCVKHRNVASYESQYTPYMDVDRPGEATFNLWAAPRAPGKQVAVSYGGHLIVQRPSAPHPTELEPHDMYATDAVITGSIAVVVQSAENVLAVLLQPIQGTKILLQNRTKSHTVMVRQQGSRRRNCIPPRQNRFFLWEDARQEHAIRVHILGYKGRWFDVDFSAGECQVTRHVDIKAATAAETLEHARQLHPHPTQVKLGAELHGQIAAAAVFPFHVRSYTNAEKTRVTVLITESPVPVYAAIDSWRTSQAMSLRMTMVQLSWIQEMSTYVAAAAKFATPFAIDGGDDGMFDDDTASVVIAPAEDADRGGDTAASSTDGTRMPPRGRLLRQRNNTVKAVAETAPASSVANVALFSIILEGVQLERLATEDNENFYFAVHQMQWVDEKLETVFVYRARPRLPLSTAMLQGADAVQGSADAAAAMPQTPLVFSDSPSLSSRAKRNASDRVGSPSKRRPQHRAGCVTLLAPIAATVNHLLHTALGRSDAFLLCMEKRNDLELSYSLIKYADGVTRYTELRCVLTPLVVMLTDFLLVDVIQEVRRLRVLLGLSKKTAASQTTTTAPLVLTVSSLQQQQQPTWRAFRDKGTGGTVMAVVPSKAAFSFPFARFSSRRPRQRSGSVVVADGERDAEVPPAEQPTPAAQVEPRHRSPNESPLSEDAGQRHRGRRAGPLPLMASRSRSSDSDMSSITIASSVCTTRTGSNVTHSNQVGERSNVKRSWRTSIQHFRRHSNPSRASTGVTTIATPPQQQRDGSTSGFLSQAVFLQQLVQEVRTRLDQRGTAVMVGSLAVPTTRGEKRLRTRSRRLSFLHERIAGAGPEARGQQLLLGATSTAVCCHRSSMQHSRPDDGFVRATTVDADGNRTVAGVGNSGARAVRDTGVGSRGSGAATTHDGAGNSNTTSLMFIERLEVQRVTLYVTFVRHRPDPLRPLLGAYAWMLPSQLRQREFYLPAWTLTRQVETPASLQARLVRWVMNSLREQWTKVTKLGTLLAALQFWRHQIVPLHGAPRALTLSCVQQQQQQQQEKDSGGRQPLATFAPCVSSGEEENDDDCNAGVQRGSSQVERPVASLQQR
nr:unnamed protein product [Leishmania braziliensis]